MGPPRASAAAAGLYRHARILAAGILLLNLAFITWLVVARPLRTSQGPASYVGLFFVNMLSAATPFFSAPGQVATFLAGAHGSFALAGLVSGIGAAIGEVPPYLVGWSGAQVVPGGWRPAVERMQAWLRRPRVRRALPLLLFGLAAIPNPTLDPLSTATGLAHVPFRTYFPCILCGKIVRLIVVAFLGHQFRGHLP